MNYYIITFTKVHHKITGEQREKIMMLDSNEMSANGQMIKYSNIADILSEDKYFEAFPDKRPTEERNDFEDRYGAQGNQQVRKPTQRAKELMKKGFLEVNKNWEGFNFNKLSGDERTYWTDVVKKFENVKRNSSEEEHYQHALQKVIG